MLKSERHDAIIHMCNMRGTVTVHEIARILDVSEMTVRRDLVELHSQNRLARIHGGARMIDPATTIDDISHLERQFIHIDEKTEAAEHLASMVHEGQTIFLGSSTTVELAAQRLPQFHLRIVTNSLPIFNLFADDDTHEIILLGGVYTRRNGTFLGPLTESSVESMGFDLAIVGVNGICGGSLYTNSIDSGRLYKTAFAHATEHYVLADSSKLGRRGFYAFYDLQPSDCIITDGGADEELLSDISQRARVIY